MAVEPMRAVSTDGVSRVIVVAPTQLLKTEFAVNVALWVAFYGEDVLFVEPDITLLEEMLADRIRPALAALGQVDMLGVDGSLRKKRDSRVELRLGGGGTIKGITPGQKTGLVARTAPTVVVDELDKMLSPDLMVRAEDRITTYGEAGRIVAASTPTVEDGPVIWAEWASGSRGVWMGKCRQCGELTSMDWDTAVRLDRDSDGFWLPRTAAVVCQGCGAIWSEGDRVMGARAGQYVHQDPDHPHRTFRVPGPAHILGRTLRSIAEAGAKAWRTAVEKHEFEAYRTWVNHRAALPWRDDVRGLSSRRLERAAFVIVPGKRDWGELDRRALFVTAASDIGGHGIRTEFVAWGADVATRRVMTWGLGYRTIGWSADDDIQDPDIWRRYEKLLDGACWHHPDLPGQLVLPARVFIDAGYEQSLVKAWCNARMQADLKRAPKGRAGPYSAWILPSRGKSRELRGEAVDLASGVRRSPGRPVTLPATVWLETSLIKDMIWESVLRDGRSPQGVEKANRWPEDAAAHGYDAEYFREFANERRSIVRRPGGKISVQWEQVHGQGKKNEAWDCRVYNTAVALFLAGRQPLRDFVFRSALKHATRVDSQDDRGDEVARLRGIVDSFEGADLAWESVDL